MLDKREDKCWTLWLLHGNYDFPMETSLLLWPTEPDGDRFIWMHECVKTHSHTYSDAFLLTFHAHHSGLLHTFSYGWVFFLFFNSIQCCIREVWRSTRNYNLPLLFSHAQSNIAETSGSERRWKRWEKSTRTFKIKVIETELTQTLSMSRSAELLSALSSIFANVCVGKMNEAEKTQHERYRNGGENDQLYKRKA